MASDENHKSISKLNSNPVKQNNPIEMEITHPKRSIPFKILEEEVWFSGSELKTDNSSSEEDNNANSKIHQSHKGSITVTDCVKKGARKKTKLIVSKSSRVKTKQVITSIETGGGCDDATKLCDERTTTTTTTVEKYEESASSGNYEMEFVSQTVQWRPKRGSISLPGLSSELEQIQI